ncbi:MAG: hypothetical protein GY804_09375 [Alphaproteobacteria bacterium]|nr:hypothetical protein [Alphaproteobacteria bacterium]
MIDSVFINRYIPVSTYGTTTIDLKVPTPVTIITGQNGCGKTHFSHLLSYKPKIKTGFSKGRFSMHLTHGTIDYVLGSDFKTKDHNHSFIKDRIELNESGGAGVQQELIIEHLGYTPIVDKITHNLVGMCSMKKAERKNIFVESNPVDINFILTYHKLISKDLRVFRNQLKSYMSRKLSLESSILPIKERQKLSDEKSYSKSVLQTIDRTVLIFNEKLNTIRRGTPEQPTDNELQLVKNIDQLGKDILSVPIVEKDQNYLTHVMASLEKLQYIEQESVKNSYKLQQELDEYKRSVKVDIDTDIEKIAHQIETTKSMLTHHKVDLNIPTINVNQSTLNSMNEFYPTLEKLLACVGQVDKEILSIKEIEGTEAQIKGLSINISNTKELWRTQEQAVLKLHKRYENCSILSFPTDCLRDDCNLRQHEVDRKNEALSNYQQIKLEFDKTTHQLNESMLSLKHLEYEIAPFTLEVKESISRICRFISAIDQDEYILGGRDLYETLSIDCSGILNKVRRVLENTRRKDVTDGLSKELNTLQFQHKTLLATKAKDVANINKLILQREGELSELNKLMTDTRGAIKIRKKQKAIIDTSNKARDLFEHTTNIIQKVFTYEIYIKASAFYEKEIDRLNNYRGELSDRLIDVSNTLKTQEGYLTRLNDEILPNIEILQKDIEEHNIICEQTSPEGIPQYHIKTFTNRVIKRANKFIKKVWMYPIKLKTYGKNEEVDFVFKLQVKESIVPDIAESSTAQSKMIDLAFTLALYIETGMNEKFPIILDEITSGMLEVHATRTIDLLIELVHDKKIKQMFLITHQAEGIGFGTLSELICWAEEGVSILNDEYNRYLKYS